MKPVTHSKPETDSETVSKIKENVTVLKTKPETLSKPETESEAHSEIKETVTGLKVKSETLSKFETESETLLGINETVTELKTKPVTQSEQKQRLTSIKPSHVCRLCGKTFQANSNREKYCNDCKPVNARKSTRNRLRKFRSRVVSL